MLTLSLLVRCPSCTISFNWTTISKLNLREQCSLSKIVRACLWYWISSGGFYRRKWAILSSKNSYNKELASTIIKSITNKNASNTYSTFNSVKFDTGDSHNKFLLYNQFVVWYCRKALTLLRYLITQIIQCFKNCQTLSEYFTSADEKIFIDLRRGKGYTNEIEKLNWDDIYLTITIKLKAAAEKNETARN